MKKRALDIAVISDVNLGHELCHTNELKAYLSSINPKKLVLNGDFIYDASRSIHSFSSIELSIIRKLIDMAANGTEIIYITGDKDVLSKKLSRLNLSNFTFKRDTVLDLDGKKAWFLHGDTLFPYNQLNKWLYQFGSWGFGLTRFINQFKQKIKSGLIDISEEFQSFNSKLNNRFENAMLRLAIDKGYSYVICGHIHQPKKELLETHKGKCTYLNSGDWITHMTALEYTFKRWKIYNYSRDKLSPFFADEDLKKLDTNDLSSLIARSSSLTIGKKLKALVF